MTQNVRPADKGGAVRKINWGNALKLLAAIIAYDAVCAMILPSKWAGGVIVAGATLIGVVSSKPWPLTRTTKT